MGELIMLLFHARTASHVLHLKSKSYAQHVALGAFYEALPDLVDTLAETYQGSHGLIDSYPTHYTPYSDPCKLMEALKTRITELRYTAAPKTDTAIQNIIDEIVALVSQTHYKLEFLR